tara:strand:- start:447 stop:842 length:396 start_codon:yes stop_codon:yes gene_type:complete
MAGTITQANVKRGPVGVVTLTCTADASDGSYPETDLTTKISGSIIALETNPGATAPTANYDIVLDDADGVDVLGAAGANRHTSTSEKVAVAFGTYFGSPVGVDDVLTLKITNNSENSAVTVVKVYYEGQGE